MPRLLPSLARLPSTRLVSMVGVTGLSLFLGAADNTCIIRIETPDTQPAGCVAVVVECEDGQAPIDTNGDGCALECGRRDDVICPAVVVECEEGQVLVDRDGDGCALECVDHRDDGRDDVICPAIAVECEDGQAPIDADGDGCALECGRRDDVICAAIAVECEDGQAPIDADGDGCALECADRRDDGSDETDPSDGPDDGSIGDVVCPAIAVECADGQAPIDADGDGCALECADRRDDGSDETDPADGRDPSDGADDGSIGDVVCAAIAVECADGQAPIDADGDGCALECSGR